MTEIDWKQDYQGEFACPECDRGKMSLAGTHRGKRQLGCRSCGTKTVTSINLNRRSLYLESRLRDEKVDWEKDYQGEFTCPECQTLGMSVYGIHKLTNKRQFHCFACRRTCQESCQVNIQAIADPTNLGVTWYTDYRIKGFVCPECQAENVYFAGMDKHSKKLFRCRSCKAVQYESIWLTQSNLGYFSDKPRAVKSFCWEEDQWDLRAINPNFDQRDLENSTLNFSTIHPSWFKQAAKRYIQHLCKAGNTFGTIGLHLSALRIFSRYLNQTDVASFQQINRSLVLNYLVQEQKVTKNKLGGLRSFFTIGTLRGWFNIDPDIIRDDNYPKQRRGNPDPLSDSVCEQIEQNLHQLPDPITRCGLSATSQPCAPQN